MSTLTVEMSEETSTLTMNVNSRRPRTTVSTQVDSVSSTSVTQRVTASASAPEASLVSQLISSEASDKRTIQILAGTLASVLGMVALYLGYRVIMKAKARRVRSTTGESYDRVIGAPGSLLSPTPSPNFRYGQERGVAPSSPFIGVEEQSMVSLASRTLASNGGMSEEREEVIAPAPTRTAARTIRSSNSSYAGSISTPPSYRSSDNTNTEGGRTTPTPDDPFADAAAYELARSQGTAPTTSSVAWTDNASVATLPSYRSFEGAEYGRTAATAATAAT